MRWGKDNYFIDGLGYVSYDQGGINLQSYETRLTLDGEEYLQILKGSKNSFGSKVLNGIIKSNKELALGVCVGLIVALIVSCFQIKK